MTLKFLVDIKFRIETSKIVNEFINKHIYGLNKWVNEDSLTQQFCASGTQLSGGKNEFGVTIEPFSLPVHLVELPFTGCINGGGWNSEGNNSISLLVRNPN